MRFQTLAIWVLVGCARESASTTPASSASAAASATSAASPTELHFVETQTNLMLTCLDDKGDLHVALRPSDVPVECRSWVRILLTDDPGSDPATVWVANTSAPDPQGRYTARPMPRATWEAEIQKRRTAAGTVAEVDDGAPPAASGSAGPPNGAAALRGPFPPIVIYGASWCGPCHQVKKYLKSKGIPFVEKDIDEDPSAQSEMRAKLTKSGRRSGSIPVIDVGGQILVGYSPQALDSAIASARKAP